MKRLAAQSVGRPRLHPGRAGQGRAISRGPSSTDEQSEMVAGVDLETRAAKKCGVAHELARRLPIRGAFCSGRESERRSHPAPLVMGEVIQRAGWFSHLSSV